jgi:HPt (histidine-containing phosphotransfer) domain-containing protein
LEELAAFRDDQISRMQSIEHARVLLEDGVEVLRRDADRIRSHLAGLQDDHTALKATAASLEDSGRRQLEAMVRFEILWKDVQRDLEGFAKELSQLGKDPSRR